MDEQNRQRFARALERKVNALSRTFALAITIVTLLILSAFLFPELYLPKEPDIVVEEPTVEFENGSHLETGLKEGEHLDLVISNCTNCHSAKMITQNRATREGWKHMIEWMQETQGLWELGDNEALILDYLAANYAPEKKGRRAPLTNIEWYELEE